MIFVNSVLDFQDTVCPLDCLAIMYDAVYSSTQHDSKQKTPVMKIRKWLKILIDRSLVLGTVDSASLHDLVTTSATQASD